jgi:hypothetical protein
MIHEEPMHVLSRAPIFTWSFIGVSQEDYQTGFQLQVINNDEPPAIIDEENTTSSNSTYTFGASNISSPLIDGSTYLWKVKVLDNHGRWSDWSNDCRFRMNSPPTVPFPISPDNSSIVNKSAPRLAWTPSTDSEGDTISYSVQLIINGSSWATSDLIKVNDTEYFLDKALTNNSIYLWRVSAFDGYQMGNYSKTMEFTTNFTQSSPTAPMNLTVHYLPFVATINWDKPISDGGSSIIDYSIYRGPDDNNMAFLGHSNETRYVDNTIAGRSSYTYKVAARNQLGEGDRSGALKVYAGDKPSKPRNLISEWGNLSIKLTWEEPADDGGFPIQHYNLYQKMSDNNYSLVEDTTGKEYFTDNLTNGVVYYFGIAAVSLAIEGEMNITNGIPHTLPSAVDNLRIDVNLRTVWLSWDAAKDPGGAQILYYKIYSRKWLANFSLAGSSPETQFSITGAQSGANYYMVSAISVFGEGAPSEEVYAFIQNSPPTANFTTNPRQDGTISTVFTFGSNSVDIDGTIETSYWDFGDGSNNYSKIATHTYKRIGDYIVTLTVTDNEGAIASFMEKVTVLASPMNHPPVLMEWDPSEDNFSVKADSTARFLVLANDIDGDNIQYRWYVDGYKKSEGREFVYKAATNGDRVIKVIISDGKDNITKEWNVSVTGKMVAATASDTTLTWMMAFLIITVAIVGGAALVSKSRQVATKDSILPVEDLGAKVPIEQPVTDQDKTQMYREVTGLLAELQNELKTPSDILKLRNVESMLRDPNADQKDLKSAYIILTELVSSIKKSAPGGASEFSVGMDVEVESNRVLNKWNLHNSGDTVITEVKLKSNHDSNSLQFIMLKPDYHKEAGAYIIGNINPGEEKIITLIFNTIKDSKSQLNGTIEYKDFKGQPLRIIKEPIEFTTKISQGASSPILERTVLSEPKASEKVQSQNLSKPATSKIPDKLAESSFSTITQGNPIPNPFKDQTFALKSLSSLPRGLPGSLSGMSMDELSEVLAASTFYELPSGDIIVKIGRKWFFGNPQEANSYLQPYKK